MSETNYSPFLEFVPNQILKASDLNSMQEKISKVIDAIGGGAAPGDNPNTVEIPSIVEWNTSDAGAAALQVPAFGQVFNAFKIADVALAKNQILKSSWYMNSPVHPDIFKTYEGETVGILHEQEEFIIFAFDMTMFGTTAVRNTYLSILREGEVTVEIEGQSMTIPLPAIGLYQLWDGDTLPSELVAKVEYLKIIPSNFTQANWEQSSPNSADFVKNRPVYSYNTPFEEEKLFDGIVSGFEVGGYTGSGDVFVENYSAAINLSIPLEMNRNYKVIFNNEEYLLKAAPGADLGLVLGNAKIAEHNSRFDPNIPFCIQCAGSIAVVSLGSYVEEINLTICTTDIIIPKGLYTFSENSELFIPSLYFIKPQYRSDPIGAIKPDKTYQIIFNNTTYVLDIEQRSLIDIVHGLGCGNNDLNNLMNGEGIPFILAQTESIMVEFYRMMSNISENSPIAKFLEVMMPLDEGLDFPASLFAVGKLGTFEIEVREIPKKTRTLPTEYLPKICADWKENNSDSINYIKNRPFYSYANPEISEPDSNFLISGEATKINAQMFPGLYTYFASIDSPEAINVIFNKSLISDLYSQVILGTKQYMSQITNFLKMVCIGNIDIFYECLFGKKITNSSAPFLIMFTGEGLQIITKEDLGESFAIQMLVFEESVVQLNPKFLPRIKVKFDNQLSPSGKIETYIDQEDLIMYYGWALNILLKVGGFSAQINFTDGTDNYNFEIVLNNVREDSDGRVFANSIQVINSKTYIFNFTLSGQTIQCECISLEM